MATKSISQLDTQATANETDLFEVAIVDENSASGYASKKESAAAIADAIVGEYQYPLRITGTTAKTVSGAINEIAGEVADLQNLEGSASGDIATFVDGSDNPLKELKISIVAVQSGSGDPSPTNVRPISGWTGANIYTRGFNLWDEEWENGSYNYATGEKSYNSNAIRTKNLIACLPNTAYYVAKTNSLPANVFYFVFFDADKNYIGNNISGRYNIVITTPTDAHYMAFWIGAASYPITTYNNDISINYPATDTAYHAYNNNSDTINIDWQDEAGTVYGGTRDIKTGELTVTHANIASYNGETINEPWISSMDKYVAGATPTTGAQVVYPLTTPVIYQLAPTEVRSLLGLNNIFANYGAITELKYTRDLNLCINDIIARIEALEGGSSNRSLSISPTLTKSLTSDSDTAEGILEGKTEEETEEETKEEAQKNER